MFTVTTIEVTGYEATGSVRERILGSFVLNARTMREAVGWVAHNIADPYAIAGVNTVGQAEYKCGGYWGETQWRITPRYA